MIFPDAVEDLKHLRRALGAVTFSPPNWISASPLNSLQAVSLFSIECVNDLISRGVPERRKVDVKARTSGRSVAGFLLPTYNAPNTRVRHTESALVRAMPVNVGWAVAGETTRRLDGTSTWNNPANLAQVQMHLAKASGFIIEQAAFTHIQCTFLHVTSTRVHRTLGSSHLVWDYLPVHNSEASITTRLSRRWSDLLWGRRELYNDRVCWQDLRL